MNPLVQSAKRHATELSRDFPSKIAVVGAGSFGSAMVRIISKAAAPFACNTDLSWYARRQSIVDEINVSRTNQQYFPSKTKFLDNIHATNDILECVRGANVIVLAMPSTFLPPILNRICGESILDENAVFVSVVKSLKYDVDQQKMITTVDCIRDGLPEHPVVALSGANLYTEMACDTEFAEATIGYDDGEKDAARVVQKITSSPVFQTSLSNDRMGVEMCGGLKNVVSLAVGFCEGLELGWNTRSAVMRAGLHEIARFMVEMEGGKRKTIFETSAGMSDLVLTCTAGRGRLLAAAFVEDSLENGFSPNKGSNIKRWGELENKLMNGMKLPDWHNAQQVHRALTDRGCTKDFPLFEVIYRIGFQGHHPKTIIPALSQSIQMAED